MRLRKLLIFVIGGLLLTLVGQVAFRYPNPPQRLHLADWAHAPETLEETTELAGQVVHAKVVRIRKTKPITLRIEGEPGGVDRIPAEIVTLELISDGAKGRGKKGHRIEVFRTGHSDVVPPTKRRPPPMSQAPPKPPGGVDQADAPKSEELGHAENALLGLVGDPPYKVGEEYVLFLTEGPELQEERGGRVRPMRIVSPEGRYKVTRQGLVPMSKRQFAQSLKGKPAKDLTDKVRRGRDRGPNY